MLLIDYITIDALIDYITGWLHYLLITLQHEEPRKTETEHCPLGRLLTTFKSVLPGCWSLKTNDEFKSHRQGLNKDVGA